MSDEPQFICDVGGCGQPATWSYEGDDSEQYLFLYLCGQHDQHVRPDDPGWERMVPDA